jgi:hypothetical protein
MLRTVARIGRFMRLWGWGWPVYAYMDARGCCSTSPAHPFVHIQDSPDGHRRLPLLLMRLFGYAYVGDDTITFASAARIPTSTRTKQAGFVRVQPAEPEIPDFRSNYLL